MIRGESSTVGAFDCVFVLFEVALGTVSRNHDSIVVPLVSVADLVVPPESFRRLDVLRGFDLTELICVSLAQQQKQEIFVNENYRRINPVGT